MPLVSRNDCSKKNNNKFSSLGDTILKVQGSLWSTPTDTSRWVCPLRNSMPCECDHIALV